MKKYVISLSVILVVLAAVFWVLRKYNYLPCEYEYVEWADTYSPTEDSTYVTQWYMRYPEFSRPIYTDKAIDSINADIRRQMTEGTDVESMSEDFMAEYKIYYNAMRQSHITDEDFIPTWYSDVQMYVLINGTRLIVTECETDTYTGGAHGMYGSYFSNYDVKSGKKLSLDDVFSDTVAVSHHVTQYFVQQYSLDGEDPLSSQGFFVDGENLPLTQNFALLPEGVLFVYNVYEIAPYAFGKCEITVPYSALRPVMKYRPDFRKADTFRQEIEPVY